MSDDRPKRGHMSLRMDASCGWSGSLRSGAWARQCANEGDRRRCGQAMAPDTFFVPQPKWLFRRSRQGEEILRSLGEGGSRLRRIPQDTPQEAAVSFILT